MRARVGGGHVWCTNKHRNRHLTGLGDISFSPNVPTKENTLTSLCLYFTLTNIFSTSVFVPNVNKITWWHNQALTCNVYAVGYKGKPWGRLQTEVTVAVPFSWWLFVWSLDQQAKVQHKTSVHFCKLYKKESLPGKLMFKILCRLTGCCLAVHQCVQSMSCYMTCRWHHCCNQIWFKMKKIDWLYQKKLSI